MKPNLCGKQKKTKIIKKGEMFYNRKHKLHEFRFCVLKMNKVNYKKKNNFNFTTSDVN